MFRSSQVCSVSSFARLKIVGKARLKVVGQAFESPDAPLRFDRDYCTALVQLILIGKIPKN